MCSRGQEVVRDYRKREVMLNDDIHARRHGGFAWAAETFQGVLTDKEGKTSQLNGRHTANWQKIGGKWLIIRDHVSCPLPTEPASR
jgi:ketosteroid isomerase-like protein